MRAVMGNIPLPEPLILFLSMLSKPGFWIDGKTYVQTNSAFIIEPINRAFHNLPRFARCALAIMASHPFLPAKLFDLREALRPAADIAARPLGVMRLEFMA